MESAEIAQANVVKLHAVPEVPQKITSEFHPHRGLTETTLRNYDIQTKFVDDIPFEVGFPYPHGKGIKIRNFNEKKFRAVGDMKDPDLFGMDKFDPGSKDSITITEGEYDAASVWQATGHKTAAVSLPTGMLSAALKCCIKHHEYINSFKKIYFCLDNDEIGQKTMRQIAALFDFNKVYLVKIQKYKDANDYLQHNEGGDFYRVWDNAKRYSPDNIISSFDDIQKALSQVKEDQIGTYPFGSLNAMLYGIHRGEIITVTGVPATPGANASGVGKTEFFRALEHHLLRTTQSNLGIIHLEEDSGTTIKAIAGYQLNVPATLPDSGLSITDIFDGFKEAVNNKDDRVHIYTSFELQDEDALLDNIRFLAVAAKCDFIFLDHITWLATGLKDEDGRLKLDRIAQRLKLLAKELRIAIIMISHTNDEGRTRGSRNIENVSNTIIKLVRDKLSVDETTRNTIYLVVDKARLGGQSGPAGSITMDIVSRKLRDITETDEYRLPIK